MDDDFYMIYVYKQSAEMNGFTAAICSNVKRRLWHEQCVYKRIYKQ
jgi:hypothetical protein